MYSGNPTARKPHGATQLVMNDWLMGLWLQERDRLADKDVAVIILANAAATAQTDPVGWLLRTLARGELNYRRIGGRR